MKRLGYKVEDRENIVTLANKMFLGVSSEAFQQRKERKESDYALWPKLLEFVQELRGLFHLE